MDFFVGGMKRRQFKKIQLSGLETHAPVIKATLPGVLLAEDLGDAREAILFFVRVLGCHGMGYGGRDATLNDTPPLLATPFLILLATPYPATAVPCPIPTFD